MPKNDIKPIDVLTYEEALSELEKIVAALESGERALEESMTLFERGQSLAKHCAGLLDKAELKVQKLVGNEISDLEEKE
jgi:exodeoxyribonuclease VII small subunit